MYRSDLDAFATFGLTAVSVLFILAIIGHASCRMLAEPTCLRAGYPEVKLTWTLRAFCVKRIDQTDVVVPIEEVRK
jgi:hypothetical protein